MIYINNHHYKEGKEENQEQDINIKHCHGRFSTLEYIHCVGLKMPDSLSLDVDLSLVTSNNLKNFQVLTLMTRNGTR